MALVGQCCLLSIVSMEVCNSFISFQWTPFAMWTGRWDYVVLGWARLMAQCLDMAQIWEPPKFLNDWSRVDQWPWSMMVGRSLQAYHESKTGLHYFVRTILHKCSRGFVMVLAICCSRSKQNIEVQLESKASLHLHSGPCCMGQRKLLWALWSISKYMLRYGPPFQIQIGRASCQNPTNADA